jgi:hypothetical protein
MTTQVDEETPVHVELAAEAVLDGWTREQVIDALIGRIRRDRGYLAYRKACNRRTRYDDQVQHDLRALALAICWLATGDPDVGSGAMSRTGIHPQATSCTREPLPARALSSARTDRLITP